MMHGQQNIKAALVLLVYWTEAMDSVQNSCHEYIHFTFFT